MSNNKRFNLIRRVRAAGLRLFRINDSPQKIALGLGLGVFLGVMPGVGIIAAIIVASLLRINRASAIIGTLITNTWLSFVTLILAIKVGSAIMHLNWHNVYDNWKIFLKDFHFANLFKSSILDIILPVALGYFIVSLCLSLLVYLLALGLIIEIRKKRLQKNHSKA